MSKSSKDFTWESESSLSSAEETDDKSLIKYSLSFFHSIKTAPPLQEDLGLLFAKDTSPYKVDLRSVNFLEKDGRPWSISVVESAKRMIAYDELINHEVTSVFGVKAFRKQVSNILLGVDNPALTERRVFSFQAVTASGGMRIVAEYLWRFQNCSLVYLPKYYPNPLRNIFLQAGIVNLKYYRHFNKHKKKFDMDVFRQDITNVPPDFAIVFDSCGYDGANPTKEEWYKIASIVQQQRIIPVFDCDCQGFKTGDIHKDVWSIRMMVRRGIELYCVQSFDRNFGLLGHCVASVTVISPTPAKIIPLKGKIIALIHGLYHYPPSFGASVVGHILSNYDLYTEWKNHFMTFSKKADHIRVDLRSTLECLGTPGDWSFLTTQQGFQTNTSWRSSEINYLREKHHIYLPMSGKMSMTGINYLNLEYVAHAIRDTFKKCP